MEWSPRPRWLHWAIRSLVAPRGGPSPETALVGLALVSRANEILLRNPRQPMRREFVDPDYKEPNLKHELITSRIPQIPTALR